VSPAARRNRDRDRPGASNGPEGLSREDQELARLTQEVAQRAIRRLDVLEWFILAAGVLLAVAAGALVAWMLAGPTGLGFRSLWIAASLALFVVPGGVAIMRIRRADREAATRAGTLKQDDDG
jgi:uncharacterized membrane protein